MAFFNEFPNTRTYDKDLGWLIHVVGQLQIEVKTFIENNTINIPDQITWDITKQYTRNTLVIDYDGTAYLSKQPVPIGIAITNTDYWMPIFNYDDSINTLRANIATNERNHTTATAERHAGDLVWLGNALYKVTVDMPAGTAYIAGTNVELYTIEDYLLFLKGAIAAEAQARESADTTLQGNIDAEVLARQGADTTLQGNIDAEVLARQGADTALQNDINALKMFAGNVKSYGAVGDGVHDDTQAFIDCIAAHSAIFVPDGDYLITSTIPIDKTVKIFGATKFKSTIMTHSNITIFEVAANVLSPQFENLRFVCDYFAADADTCAIKINYSHHGSINRCVFTGFKKAFYSIGTAYWNVSNSFFYNNENDLNIQNLTDIDEGDSTIINNYFFIFTTQNYYNSCVHIYNNTSSATKIIGNKFLGGVRSIEVALDNNHYCVDYMIENNSLENTLDDYIYLHTDGAAHIDNVNICGNQMSGVINNNAKAIRLEGKVRKTCISGNNIISKAGTGIGIDLNDDCDDCAISGNTFNWMNIGIRNNLNKTTAAKMTIGSNNFGDNVKYPIYNDSIYSPQNNDTLYGGALYTTGSGTHNIFGVSVPPYSSCDITVSFNALISGTGPVQNIHFGKIVNNGTLTYTDITSDIDTTHPLAFNASGNTMFIAFNSPAADVDAKYTLKVSGIYSTVEVM